MALQNSKPHITLYIYTNTKRITEHRCWKCVGVKPCAGFGDTPLKAYEDYMFWNQS
jgi:hypothetical protein